MLDLAVVGAGIFGQTVAKLARKRGMSVSIIGVERRGQASSCAGGVVKPSWLSKMSRAQIEEALGVLQQLWGLHSVRFALPLKKGFFVEAFRVDPSSFLLSPDIQQEVSSIEVHGSRALLSNNLAIAEASWVVVATGMWTQELCPWAGLVTSKWGASHRTKPLQEARIVPWAPYRQVVGLNLSDGDGWAGDGLGLLERSWSSERLRQSSTRCVEKLGLCQEDILLSRAGGRPYAAEAGSEPCLLSRQGRVICVTGGAKNGVAGAAWAAMRVMEIIS